MRGSLLTFVLLGLSATCLAGEFPAVADSTISAKSATKKLGAGKNLLVDKDSDAFLRFDLSSLPEGTRPEHVSKATLRLWVRSKPTPGVVSLALPVAGWSESEISDATAPLFQPTGIVKILPTDSRTFMEFDVTSLVMSWIDGVPNLGLVVTPEIPGNPLRVEFDSRENTQTGHVPTLDVTLDRVSTFRAFEFTILKNEWDSGYHYGDSNNFRFVTIDPSRVGGIQLDNFHYYGGLVQVEVAPLGKNGYNELRAVPHVFSFLTSPAVGLRLDYLPARGVLALGKTTNGWDSLTPITAEVPDSVNVRMTLMGTGLKN
jgi:hypothetical protein